jgi:hypothetical protein
MGRLDACPNCGKYDVAPHEALLVGEQLRLWYCCCSPCDHWQWITSWWLPSLDVLSLRRPVQVSEVLQLSDWRDHVAMSPDGAA